MILRRCGSLTAIFLSLLLLQGCVRINIGDEVVDATRGKELVDLEIALEKGVISLAEFAKLRGAILDI